MRKTKITYTGRIRWKVKRKEVKKYSEEKNWMKREMETQEKNKKWNNVNATTF